MNSKSACKLVKLGLAAEIFTLDFFETTHFWVMGDYWQENTIFTQLGQDRVEMYVSVFVHDFQNSHVVIEFIWYSKTTWKSYCFSNDKRYRRFTYSMQFVEKSTGYDHKIIVSLDWETLCTTIYYHVVWWRESSSSWHFFFLNLKYRTELKSAVNWLLGWCRNILVFCLRTAE